MLIRVRIVFFLFSLGRSAGQGRRSTGKAGWQARQTGRRAGRQASRLAGGRGEGGGCSLALSLFTRATHPAHTCSAPLPLAHLYTTDRPPARDTAELRGRDGAARLLIVSQPAGQARLHLRGAYSPAPELLPSRRPTKHPVEATARKDLMGRRTDGESMILFIVCTC